MEIEKEYLSTIKSTSKNSKYKRVCLSPLRYAGGKSKAVGLILENFPILNEKKVNIKSAGTPGGGRRESLR